MNQLLSLLLPASLLFAGPAPEGERGPRHGKMEALDTDGSGTLSADEVEGTRLAEHFSKIDTDGNGELTKEELKAGRKGHKGKRGRGKGKRGKQLDTNGDGALSQSEVEGTRLAEHFSQIDANSDGQLTPEELRAGHRKGKRPGKGKKPKRGGKRGQQ